MFGWDKEKGRGVQSLRENIYTISSGERGVGGGRVRGTVYWLRYFYRYDEKLKEAKKLGAKKGLGVGASLGGVIFTLFAIYGAVFWFGAYLISERITDGGEVLAVFFSVLIGALSLGQAFPNLQNLFEAAGAAGAIYETIDRVSLLHVS